MVNLVVLLQGETVGNIFFRQNFSENGNLFHFGMDWYQVSPIWSQKLKIKLLSALRAWKSTSSPATCMTTGSVGQDIIIPDITYYLFWHLILWLAFTPLTFQSLTHPVKMNTSQKKKTAFSKTSNQFYFNITSCVILLTFFNLHPFEPLFWSIIRSYFCPRSNR